MSLLLMWLVLAILGAVVGAILLFGIVLLVASIFGGASVALLIKDKTVKRLLFIGCSILLLIALICLSPFATLIEISIGPFIPIIVITLFALILVLAIAGIRISKHIGNKIGKIVARILFIIVCIGAISFMIFFGIWMLFSN